MRVLQIGGIFGQTPEFRARNLQTTTETLLVDHLPAHGISVGAQAHGFRNDLRGFDLVHVHHLANSCVTLSLHKPIPMVFTRHGLNRPPRAHHIVLAAIQARADALVALSDFEADLLRSCRRAAAQVRRIYNGVDANIFHGEKRARPSKSQPWQLLFVGQLIPLKRAHIAIQAVASLVNVGHDTELTIVSHRPTLEPSLRDLSERLGVSSRVKFAGALGQSEVAQMMRLAHALLLTSDSESLPTVVTEAVLTALPVVTFDVGGVMEQLPPGVSAVAVPDVQGYISSVHRLIENYTNMVDVYSAHRRSAARRFSIDAMVQNHADLYRSLV